VSNSDSRRIVLVVEDDETIGGLLATVINDEPGYNAVLVRNGAEALDALSGAKFDLVLLDLVLPGLSGIELLDRLRADPANRSVPVLVVSGTALEESEALRDRGIPAFVKKPFDVGEVLALVREFAPLRNNNRRASSSER
jgi:DNA-binding response OmpR family regulator